MTIDASIPLKIRPWELDSPIENEGKLQTIQNLMTRQRIGEFGLGQAQQEAGRMSSLRGILGQTQDPMAQAQAITRLGDPYKGLELQSQVAGDRAAARKAEFEQKMRELDLRSGAAHGLLTTSGNKQMAYQQAQQSLRAAGVDISEDPPEYPGDQAMLQHLSMSPKWKEETKAIRDQEDVAGAQESAEGQMNDGLVKALQKATAGEPYDPRFKKYVEKILVEGHLIDPVSGALLQGMQSEETIRAVLTKVPSITDINDPLFFTYMQESLLIGGREDLATKLAEQRKKTADADKIGTLIRQRDQYPQGSDAWQHYDNMLKKETTFSPNAGNTTNINMPKVETAARTESNKNFVEKEYRATQEDAKAARTANALLDAQGRLGIDGKTGWTTPAKAYGARILASFGVPDADKFSADAEVFNSVLGQQVWVLLEAQKGVQTEGDAQRARGIFAQLGNRPQANLFIRDLARALNNRRLEKSDFYNDNYDAALEAGDVSKLEREWSRKADRSILDDPVMKKWLDVEEKLPKPKPIEQPNPFDQFDEEPAETTD